MMERLRTNQSATKIEFSYMRSTNITMIGTKEMIRRYRKTSVRLNIEFKEESAMDAVLRCHNRFLTTVEEYWNEIARVLLEMHEVKSSFERIGF